MLNEGKLPCHPGLFQVLDPRRGRLFMIKGAMPPTLQLILGGARSGKSRYALGQPGELSAGSRIFIATALAEDEEMKKRIELHRTVRENHWQTLEEPYHLAEALERAAVSPGNLVVVDCLTLWISNLLCGKGGKTLTPEESREAFKGFLHTLPKLAGTIRLVSNEVGLGIVPATPLGRHFRDLQGELNQAVAVLAGEVILMTAGIPQKIK